MMRIVNLGRTGLYVVLRAGELEAIDGRTHWRSLEDVRTAARSAKLTVSDMVVHTAM